MATMRHKTLHHVFALVDGKAKHYISVDCNTNSRTAVVVCTDAVEFDAGDGIFDSLYDVAVKKGPLVTYDFLYEIYCTGKSSSKHFKWAPGQWLYVEVLDPRVLEKKEK